MESKWIKITNLIIEHSFYALFVLVPLILTSITSELFEFNKMMLTYALTVVIITAWFIKMVFKGRVKIKKTPLDVPLLLFLISQILSAIFSIDRHTSLWGYYSRFHQGLFSTLSYLLLFYAFVSFADKKFVKNCLKWSLFSAFLVSLYGILEHFGIDAKYWVQDVKNRVFSTLGQPNWLAAYLVAIIPITWAFTLKQELRSKKQELNKKLFIIHCSSFIILYLCLLYTKSRSGLLGFIAAYLVFWPLTFLSFRKNLKQIKKPFVILTSCFIILSLLVGTPWTPKISELKTHKEKSQVISSELPVIYYGGTESGEIRKIVWRGAVNVWKHYPFFGSGVETFAYSYYNFRPREHNDVSEWDFLYNKAHNEYLNFVATTGAFGLGSYLLIIGVFIFWGLRNHKSPLSLALLAGFTSVLVTNFFGFSVVIVGLLFFLLPALSFVLNGNLKSFSTIKLPKKLITYNKFLIPIIILISCFMLLILGKFWYADTQFAKGKKLNKKGKYQEALESLQRATALRDSEPVYHDEVADTLSNLSNLAQKAQDATLAGELKDLALKESETALRTGSKRLNFLKTRIKIYLNLANQDKKYYLDALNYLEKAQKLAPTDAKLIYNQAIVHYYLGQENTAIELLNRAINLKPNYRDAHATLSILYRLREDYDRAEEHLKIILEKINPQDEEALLFLETIRASQAAQKK